MSDYRIRYRCTNCEHQFDEILEKGKTAPQHAVCPNCGCNTGRKMLNQPSIEECGLVDYGIAAPKENGWTHPGRERCRPSWKGGEFDQETRGWTPK